MLQCAAIILTFNVAWHESLRWLEFALNLALFSVDVFRPDCVLTWGFERSFYLQVQLSGGVSVTIAWEPV